MPVRRRFSIALRLRILRRGTLLAIVATAAHIGGAGCSGLESHTAAHSPEANQVFVPPPPEPLATKERAVPQIAADAIEPDDVLEVTIAAGLSAEDIVTVPSRVSAQGFVLLPEIGPVAVQGLTLPDAEEAIRRAGIVRRLYRDPLVTVIRKTSRPHQVAVLGAVKEAGTYSLPHGSRNLLSAIQAAGGLSEDAGTDVEILLPETPLSTSQNRATPVSHFASSTKPGVSKTVHIQLTSHQDASAPNQSLPHGSIVRVNPRAKSSVQVLGLVHRCGLFEFSVDEDFRLLDAIALADGVQGPIANRAVIVRHQSGDAAPLLLQADLKRAGLDPRENPRLMPGDIIHIEETPVRRFGQFLPRLPWAIWTNES